MKASDLGPRSIALVVDDNPDSLNMVSTALENHGMTVLLARDGRSAIDVTHRVSPDVILMDAVMPGMDGFETCRALKFGPGAVLSPVIFMTGLCDQPHILKGLRAGGVDYITKPVILDEMLARVTTHIVNYKLIQSARDALDSVGRAVLAFDAEMQILWGTQKAKDIVERSAHGLDWAVLRQWIAACAARPVSATSDLAHAGLVFRSLGVSAGQERLVRVSYQESGNNTAMLQEGFDITAREAEVLYWLTLGKTNRDIGAILDIGVRTVNKHLEQIFQKMGVDNRTSAAIAADRILSREV
ncbi:MAG: DNA-binding response regulator [Loktanella sp.]|nr:DNA-binding response regulator [Loktanella sp.]